MYLTKKMLTTVQQQSVIMMHHKPKSQLFICSKSKYNLNSRKHFCLFSFDTIFRYIIMTSSVEFVILIFLLLVTLLTSRNKGFESEDHAIS